MTKKILFAVLAFATLNTITKAETVIALTSGDRLLTFDSATPGTITKTVTVTGPGAAKPVLAIDFRPATGELYGLSGTSRIEKINTSVSGNAVLLGSIGGFSSNGSSQGFDFNPVVDKIRITSDAGQNLRIDPDTGTTVSTDPVQSYAAGDPNAGTPPILVGAAYTNSFSTAAATVLYVIDSRLDVLAIQDPANAGTLRTVGPLGVDTTTAGVGFDISGNTGVAYAALTVGTTTNLYTINLVTGAATLVGPIASPAILGSETIVGIAAGVPPSSKLLNIATRGRVGLGEDVLIGGFISRSGTSSRYVIRAIGPSLSGLVSGPLADPVLSLRDINGNVITSNDDWITSAQAAEITALGLAPSNNAESVILATLAPNNYTAIISGKGTNTGVAVVEIYALQ